MTIPPLDVGDSALAWLGEHEEDLVAVRRQLHANPELSGEEQATTELIAERLRLAGLQPRVLHSGTGLICDLGDDAGSSSRLAFRADLDALAMDDEKDVEYRSRVPGVAHACGHDVHTAVVLGAVLFFAHRPDELPGPLRFVFQPAEEAVPGGALAAIESGALDDVGAMVGIHCDPKLGAGRVGLKSGAISSAADMAEIRLTGPGGHTARPEETVDMVRLLARVVSELPARVTAGFDDPGLVRVVFGMVRSGDAANVVPTTGMLRASIRTRSLEAWERLPDTFRSALSGVLEGTGAQHTIDYVHGVPPVVNDPELTQLASTAAIGELGQAAVVPASQSWGGDDFAWYAREVPSTFIRLGVGDPAGRRPALDLHTGAFDVDESAISVGVRVLAATASAYSVLHRAGSPVS